MTQNNMNEHKNGDFFKIATWIICGVFAVVMALFLMGFWMHKPQVVEHKIEIVYNDTISQGMDVTYQHLVVDSIVTIFNQQQSELTRNYELFMQARRDDADLTKLISCLGGFIIALFALFGIKNYRDFQESIRQETTDKVNKIVNGLVPIKVDKLLNRSIKTNDYFIKLKDAILNTIHSTVLNQLENRIQRIEESISPDSDSDIAIVNPNDEGPKIDDLPKNLDVIKDEQDG